MVGDAYVVAGGVPSALPDHRAAAVNMALGMQDLVKNQNGRFRDLEIRIGIEAGPTVAGVIGQSRFLYDLWGDAVNTASRMESHGLPGEIQVTRAFADSVAHQFTFRSRGTIEIKGKGSMEVLLVET